MTQPEYRPKNPEDIAAAYKLAQAAFGDQELPPWVTRRILGTPSIPDPTGGPGRSTVRMQTIGGPDPTGMGRHEPVQYIPSIRQLSPEQLEQWTGAPPSPEGLVQLSGDEPRRFAMERQDVPTFRTMDEAEQWYRELQDTLEGKFGPASQQFGQTPVPQGYEYDIGQTPAPQFRPTQEETSPNRRGWLERVRDQATLENLEQSSREQFSKMSGAVGGQVTGLAAQGGEYLGISPLLRAAAGANRLAAERRFVGVEGPDPADPIGIEKAADWIDARNQWLREQQEESAPWVMPDLFSPGAIAATIPGRIAKAKKLLDETGYLWNKANLSVVNRRIRDATPWDETKLVAAIRNKKTGEITTAQRTGKRRELHDELLERKGVSPLDDTEYDRGFWENDTANFFNEHEADFLTNVDKTPKHTPAPPAPRTAGGTRKLSQMTREEFENFDDTYFHGTSGDWREYMGAVHLPGRAKLHPGDIGTWFAMGPNGRVTAEEFAKKTAARRGGVARTNSVSLNFRNPKIYRTYDEFLDATGRYKSGVNFQNKLSREGFDGIIIRESNTDSGLTRQDAVAFRTDQIKSHRDLVEETLSEGGDVPSRVLADYPDLAPTPRTAEGARIPWSTREGTPVQRAEAFDALPGDAEVTLFHATSDANAANLIGGGKAVPQRQGRGIEAIDDGIYVGTDPISVEGMGPRILAVTVKKSQVSPSSEFLRTSPDGTAGRALVQGAATGGVVRGKPIRVEDVTDTGRYAFAADAAPTPRTAEGAPPKSAARRQWEERVGATDEAAEAAAQTQRGKPEVVMNQITAYPKEGEEIPNWLGNLLEHVGDLSNRAQQQRGIALINVDEKLRMVERLSRADILGGELARSREAIKRPLAEYKQAHLTDNQPVTEMGQVGKDMAVALADLDFDELGRLARKMRGMMDEIKAAPEGGKEAIRLRAQWKEKVGKD